MSKPLLSIIIPVYNVEQYLEECVQSVLNQTFTKFELILVDDGSPDGCPQMCDEYARQDCRVRVIHKENGGLSSARNAGLDAATGEYIGFIDSDDYIGERMYELLMNEVLSGDADIAICGVAKVKCGVVNPIKTVDIRREMCGLEATKEVLLDERIFSFAVDKVYRASLWSGIRYPLGVFFEDTQTTYKLFERCKYVVQIPEVVYYYRIHNASICRNPNPITIIKRTIDNFKAFLERYLFVRENKLYKDVLTACAEKAFVFATDALLYDMKLNNSKNERNILTQFSDVNICHLPKKLWLSAFMIKRCFPLYKHRLRTRISR